MAGVAVHRAEENELIEVLSEHFLVRDAETLATCVLRWRGDDVCRARCSFGKVTPPTRSS